MCMSNFSSVVYFNCSVNNGTLNCSHFIPEKVVEVANSVLKNDPSSLGIASSLPEIASKFHLATRVASVLVVFAVLGIAAYSMSPAKEKVLDPARSNDLVDVKEVVVPVSENVIPSQIVDSIEKEAPKLTLFQFVCSTAIAVGQKLWMVVSKAVEVLLSPFSWLFSRKEA